MDPVCESEAEAESPARFLEREVFSVLLPGLEETLQVAKKTERRKLFNSVDYLAWYLYRHNPKHQNRGNVPFEEIPFVKEEWTKHPRPPLPLSATLTEEQAVIIIQSFYRGYLVRRESQAQLFRSWQRAVWKERQAVKKIQKRWRKFSSLKNLFGDSTTRLNAPSPVREESPVQT